MHLPHVISCGVYRDAQKFAQQIDVQWINLTVSGLKHHRMYYPDGTPADKYVSAGKHLSLGFPGFRSEFEFGPDRENWVLMFELPEFQYDPHEHLLILQEGAERLPLVPQAAIVEEDVHELRETFAEITRFVQSALPADRLQADCLAAMLFRRFLPSQNGRADTPAERLRQRLDQDREHRSSLKEHCRAVGMTPDHLRRVFRAEFGITPVVYRERRQKNDLLSLFTYSTLSFKEIADRLGLKHVQHLNLLTERYFHCTPKELLRRCRKNLMYVESSPTR